MLDLGRTFLQSAERAPNACAIVDGAVRLSYGEWLARVASAAAGLTDLGFRHGDHLGVVMQNRWEFATLHWACQFLGVVTTPLNWRAKVGDIDYCLGDADARALAFDASAADEACAAPRARTLPRIGVGAVGGATIAFDDWMRAGSPPALVPVAAADDISVMLYTSGTTGRAKGVPRRHRTERIAALAHVAQNCYAIGERTLGVMPLHHTMGVRSLLSMALVDGTFVSMARFEPAAALEAIVRERVTNLYLVPTLYHDLLADPAFGRADVSSVRKLGFAGAPMTDALLARLEAAFHPDLFVNHYGSSEVYTVSINQKAPAKPGSAGRASLNTRLRVVKLGSVSPDAHAGVGEEGQIIVEMASDEAFEGYHRRPDADAKSIRGGWFYTGDTGVVDADGDLFVTGRVDDMIIWGGENISPTDIESVLSLHPAVDEVAVAGLPDERWGQKVVAFVKRRAPVAADDLDAHCRASSLANFKRPREYVFVQEVPKSPIGKLLRRKLVAGEYERV